MKTTLQLSIFTAVATVFAAVSAETIDFTTPLVFSGNTEITESETSGWITEQDFAVSVTGIGNVLNGRSGEANPWRRVYLTGDGYLTMTRNGQWSIGFNADNGGTTNFYGTLHIVHQGWGNPVYFGTGKGVLSMANAKIILQPWATSASMEVYMSNYQSDTRFGDLSTAGDYSSSVVVRHKVNNATLRVGYRNENSTFAGSFLPNENNTYNLDKVGTGIWTLQGPVSINGTFSVSEGTVILDGNTVSCAMTVASGASIRGTGTISGAVSAASGAKLLYSAEEVLTFTDAANLNGFIVDATGCDASQEYLVAKGTLSLPGVSAAQSALGWMTEAKNGNVYLVNRMMTITSDVVLDADADWSGNVVSVADNVTIDLNGHSLSVAGIALGTGATFVNNGAGKSRLYAGFNGAEKSWVLDMNLGSNIMPVFVGVAITIPQSYVPEGGIGFKNTSGTQYIRPGNCANGLAFLGNATLTEEWTTWNSPALACTVIVESEDNSFQFNNQNGATEPPGFRDARFVGSGNLSIIGCTTSAVAPIVGNKDTIYDGFSGMIRLVPASTFANSMGMGARFEDDNNMSKAFTNGTISLVWDGANEVLFTLRTQNWGTPPTYNIGNLVTEGEHPENIVLRPRFTGGNGTHIKDYTLKVGWKNEDGVFAGSITNEYYQGVDNEVAFDGTENINIEKHGTGTWKLTGTVANGGTFAVATGGVEFRNGLANVTSLTVASGASVLFAGDMGSNPIVLASGSTLKLDASNEGGNVPVVNGSLDLTGVNVYVSQGTYVPSKTTPRELLRVTGTLTGFNRGNVGTDIVEQGWAFRAVDNGDGTKSIVHQKRAGFAVIIR